ncbi:hypothetical protein T484DRAFT_1905136 [Baffinella frigidus]|nr:hypothetical protein T484DRAFT_1905136 [Cryptophyta sp. CCMP2293]
MVLRPSSTGGIALENPSPLGTLGVGGAGGAGGAGMVQEKASTLGAGVVQERPSPLSASAERQHSPLGASSERTTPLGAERISRAQYHATLGASAESTSPLGASKERTSPLGSSERSSLQGVDRQAPAGAQGARARHLQPRLSTPADPLRRGAASAGRLRREESMPERGATGGGGDRQVVARGASERRGSMQEHRGLLLQGGDALSQVANLPPMHPLRTRTAGGGKGGIFDRQALAVDRQAPAGGGRRASMDGGGGLRSSIATMQQAESGLSRAQDRQTMAGSLSRAQQHQTMVLRPSTAVPPHIQTLIDAADDARACLDAPPASDTTTSGASIATGLLSASGARKPSASQARPRTAMLPAGGRRASIDGGEDLWSWITKIQQPAVSPGQPRTAKLLPHAILQESLAKGATAPAIHAPPRAEAKGGLKFIDQLDRRPPGA